MFNHNYFMIALILMQTGAGVQYVCQGRGALGALTVLYAVCNVLLFYIGTGGK